MKRILALLLAMGLLLSGCGGGSTGSDAPVANITPAQIDSLFAENLYCMRYLFVLGTLPYANEPVSGENIYPVTSDRFKTYAQLEEYLHTVYTDEEVARLLDADGAPLYMDIDGMLCVNTKRIGGKPYTVDWTGRKIEINSRDAQGCVFTAIGKYVEQNTDVDPAPYLAEGRATYENGRLLLEEMII